MSIYVTDVEADGPCPGLYSLLQIGCVKVTPELDTTFCQSTKPLESASFVQGALDSIGLTREETLLFADPKGVMQAYVEWVEATTNGRPVFVSDNNGFDWQFINYYCHYYVGRNPFGFSSRRIGDLYSGLERDFFAASKWKSLRKTKHSHDALDDAMGNAEALIAIATKHKIKIPQM